MTMNSRKITQFWVLQVFQAAAAFVWILLTPSNEPQFLGLSYERLALAGLVFLLFAAMLAVLVLLVRKPALAEKVSVFLDSRLIERKRLVPVILILLLSSAVIVWVVSAILSTPLEKSAFEVWAPDTFLTLYFSTQRLLQIIVLLTAFLVESAIFVAITYRDALKNKSFWSLSVIASGLIGWVICAATLAHWFIQVLRLRIFMNLPAWYWAVTNKPFSVRDVVYTLIAAVLLAAAVWLTLSKKRVKLALVLVFLASLWLQMGVDYLDGRSTQEMGERYFISSHAVYPKLASENRQTLGENLKNYMDVFWVSTFTRTKPPGLMGFYLSLERLVNGNAVEQTMTDVMRLQRLRSFMVYAFPLWSAGFVFIFYAFLRKCLKLEASESMLAVIAIILCPNFVLFSLMADQALYPVLFLLMTWLIVSVVRRQLLVPMFLLGALLYICSYFAFTMLPLFPIAGFYLLLHWLMNRKTLLFRRQFLMGVLFLAGVAVCYGLFRWALNYDFFARFSDAMAINHNFDFYLRVGKEQTAVETFGVRLQQIIGSMGLNNLEFATISGAAVYLLFILNVIQLIARFARHQADEKDGVLASMMLAFLAVNLGGSAQGEVGRLWLFWAPMVVTSAVLELRNLKIKKSAQFAILCGVQLITLLLTYHFQDLLLSN